MAIAAPASSASVGRIKDPVTIRESIALFARTGFDVNESNLRRWAKLHGLKSVRSRGTTWYSWSELLVLHRERVLDREFVD